MAESSSPGDGSAAAGAWADDEAGEVARTPAPPWEFWREDRWERLFEQQRCEPEEWAPEKPDREETSNAPGKAPWQWATHNA